MNLILLQIHCCILQTDFKVFTSFNCVNCILLRELNFIAYALLHFADWVQSYDFIQLCKLNFTMWIELYCIHRYIVAFHRLSPILFLFIQLYKLHFTTYMEWVLVRRLNCICTIIQFLLLRGSHTSNVLNWTHQLPIWVIAIHTGTLVKATQFLTNRWPCFTWEHICSASDTSCAWQKLPNKPICPQTWAHRAFQDRVCGQNFLF